MNNPAVRRPDSWPQSQRRTKYERWAELLESCVWEERTQSWLMRSLGMKTQIIKEDLTFLLKANLLEQVDAPEVGIFVYRTTIKGKEALSKFYQLVTRFFM